MKTFHLLAAIFALAPLVHAVDTTPPTLNITHTWIEKVGSRTHFRMFLDPQDETGLSGESGIIDAIKFRSALNTSTIPAAQPWQFMPWKRGEPFDLAFNCTSCVIELRVKDEAGNYSPVQTRYFASPFPYSPTPNVKPSLVPGENLGVKERYAGSAANLRGLFCGRFDGVGSGDDLVQVDRATGNITVRRQISNQPVRSDVSFSLAADTIEDSISADFDTDSRADLAIIAGGALTVYHNDGLDGSGVVQFGAQTINTTGTGITVFKNLATGDVNGDGKLDIIVTGEDASANPRIGWLIANATWQYDSSDGVPAPAGTTPGKLAVGDMNGDGKLDVVVVDAANNQMILFKNKGTALAGDGEADTNYQPTTTWTGLGQAGPNPAIPFIFSPVKALAIGDVTGDGKPDIIAVFAYFSYDVSVDDGHVFQKWRLYENRGSTFRPFDNASLGQSVQINAPTGPPPGAEDIPCDVLLQDLNDDRFPEILLTNYYGNSVKIIRFTPLLNEFNLLTTLDDGTGNPELDEQDYVPVPATGDSAYTGPSRLARGKLYSNAKINSIAMAFAGSDKVCWEINTTRASSKSYQVQGGTVTDSDAVGTEGANGLRTYSAFIGEQFTTTLTAINNSANALNNVFLDVAYPPNCSIDTSFTDPGWAPVTIGSVKYVRWTVSIPANNVVTKNFRMKILTGTVGTTIAQTAYLRSASTLSTDAMPKVTIKDPVKFTVTVESQSDNSGGDTAHAEEWIAYRLRMQNFGSSNVVTNTLLFTVPKSTTRYDQSPDSVLGVTPEFKIGSTIYTRWLPNTTYALNQKVIGWNNYIFQCTANGISGASEPAWNVGVIDTTNDGPVVWKRVGIAEVAVNSLTWRGFDLAPGDDKTVEVRVKIKAGLATGTKITRGAISFTRSDGTKQSAASGYITTLLNPLEITLNANKSNALPGEIVRYTFSVTNHNFYNMGNCKVVDSVPAGMVFVESGASDGTDSGVSGGTGNFNQFPGHKRDTVTPTSLPVSLDIANVLTWNLGTIPARATRTIEFDLQVQGDVPNSYKSGVSSLVTSISNSGYNFVGNNPAGTRLFYLKPTLGTTLGTPQSASGAFLTAANTALKTTIDEGAPVNSPSIYLVKSFTAADTVQIGGESYALIVNATDDTADGVCTVTHIYGNTGAGDARRTVIRDVIPTNMTFAGGVQKNFVAFSNFTGWRFFDAAGKELLPGEAFTDTNGNGFYDAGEPYTDANNNKKFDGITASLVRSFDIFVGDVAGGSSDPLGNGGVFSYKLQATTTAQGTIIESKAGGVSGTKDGVSYTSLAGYYISAENLRFPSNGNPEVCRGIITAPAKVKFPMGTVKSRSDLKDNETATVTVPYEVTGGTGVNLSDLKLDLDIPKGYSVVSAKIYNTAGAITRSYVPGGTGNTISVTINSAGVSHITFPLDGARISYPQFEIGVNPLTKSALLTNGVTTKPLTYKPVITGKWVRAAVPPPIAAAMARAGLPPPPPPAPVALAATETFGTLPTLADSTKDTRLFVTRIAPVSAKRGDSIQYIIVVGNLTLTPLSPATITFKVPKGLRGINVSQYAYHNGVGVGFVSTISPATGRMDAVNHIRRWDTANINTLLASDTTITISTGALTDKEVGVVFLTCYVPPDFVGDYIDDNSVVFDVPNACAKSPGPSRVVLRSGTVEAERASITATFLDGIQMRNSSTATAALNASFSLTEQSCHFGMGGGDVLAMKNGLAMISLPGSRIGSTLVYDRVLVIGPPAAISAPTGNFIFLRNDPLLLAGPQLAVAVGPGNTNTGIKLVDPPSYSAGLLKPSDLLLQMRNQGANIVAGGGGNIVAGGGGNIVAAGGGNLSSVAGSAFIEMPDGSPFIVSAFTDAKLIGHDGSTIVAAGGGNAVVRDGGHIVAAGGGNLVGQDAAGVVSSDSAGVVSSDGAGLVGQDGASIVAGGGMNLISVGTGNLIQANGLTQGLNK